MRVGGSLTHLSSLCMVDLAVSQTIWKDTHVPEATPLAKAHSGNVDNGRKQNYLLG